MIEKSESSREKIFVMCSGYLNIVFNNANQNSIDSQNELRRKLFFVSCTKCEDNDYLRAKTEIENMNGQVLCKSCKSEKISILWNIKAVFMDSNAEVPCKINS